MKVLVRKGLQVEKAANKTDSLPMCRVFGFRSVILGQVNRSLVDAENALMQQSEFHPDGWGVAYYLSGVPHLIKSTQSAISDSLFQQVSGIVSSQTVVAHLRKATVGELSILNSHPFQFGRWIFAHNGNIKNFGEVEKKLRAEIKPEFRRFILGKTDSEVLFFFLLSKISEQSDVHAPVPDYKSVSAGLETGIKEVVEIIGPIHKNDQGSSDENYLTFVLTDGCLLFGFQGGKVLYCSTYKTLCPERHTCEKFAANCENPPEDGRVNHLIFSSEVLHGENIWNPMEIGELISVNEKMEIFRKKLSVASD